MLLFFGESNMKDLLTAFVAILATFGFASTGSAAAINPVNMSSGDVVTGDVFDDDGTAPANQFWITFSAAAGDTVDLDINRTAASADLYATSSFGDVTGIDDSAVSGGDLNIGTHLTWTAELGLTFIENQDDTEDDPFGGAFGDPRFTFVAANTGVYSVAVVAYTNPTDGAQAEASLTITPVPEPATAVILSGIAALSICCTRRRR